MSEMAGYFLIFYMAIVYAVGMVCLIVSHESSLRKTFSNLNIIDINTSLSDMNLIKCLEFNYIEIGD